MDTDEEPSGLSLSSETETGHVGAGALCVVVGIDKDPLLRPLCEEFTYSFNHFLPASISDDKKEITVFVDIRWLVSIYYALQIKKKNNGEEITDISLPTFNVNISYKDIGGKFHEQLFKYNIKIHGKCFGSTENGQPAFDGGFILEDS